MNDGSPTSKPEAPASKSADKSDDPAEKRTSKPAAPARAVAENQTASAGTSNGKPAASAKKNVGKSAASAKKAANKPSASAKKTAGKPAASANKNADAPGTPANKSGEDTKAPVNKSAELKKRARKMAIRARREREAAIIEAEGAAEMEKLARQRAQQAMARAKYRHLFIILSFILVFVTPVGVSAFYLWTRAADQYASSLGFTVRREEVGSAIDILGGLGDFTSSGSTDTDILYEFIQSQELVANVDKAADLRSLYSRHYETDPVFGFDPDGSIEDLVRYWRRMVRISYDSGSGLMELRIHAFDPEEAHTVAELILDESSKMINELSAMAREDATRYAREDLDQAVKRLKDAREAITSFRSRTQIVDPNTVLQGQIGILTTLQQQLASAYIELDLLRDTTREGDPRLVEIERKIVVIQDRIASERKKFSRGEDGTDYASIVSEFERLTVDREFAEQTYTAALSNFDGARAEAQRQSRYLATFVKPTVAQTSEYPSRLIILLLVALFSFLVWAIITLVYYSLRDRR